MYTMQTGTQMSKMKGKKNGLVRFFYLDEHKSCIRWRPSKKQDKAKSELSASMFLRGCSIISGQDECFIGITSIYTLDLLQFSSSAIIT